MAGPDIGKIVAPASYFREEVQRSDQGPSAICSRRTPWWPFGITSDTPGYRLSSVYLPSHGACRHFRIRIRHLRIRVLIACDREERRSV